MQLAEQGSDYQKEGCLGLGLGMEQTTTEKQFEHLHNLIEMFKEKE